MKEGQIKREAERKQNRHSALNKKQVEHFQPAKMPTVFSNKKRAQHREVTTAENRIQNL